MLLQLCFFWMLLQGTAGKATDPPTTTSSATVTTPTTPSSATTKPPDADDATSTSATTTTVASTTVLPNPTPSTASKPPTIPTTVHAKSSNSSTNTTIVPVSGTTTSKYPGGNTTAQAVTGAPVQSCSQGKAVKFLACLVAFLIIGILVYAWMQYRKRKRNSHNERLDPDPFSVDNTFTAPIPMSEPVVIDQLPDDLIEFATARAKQSNPAPVIPHIEN